MDVGIRQAIAAKCAVMLFVRAIRSNTLEFADGDLWPINLAVVAGKEDSFMGYCLAVGKCVACPAIVSFNPKKVPSIRVRWEQGRPIPDANGTREPLCRACAEAINAGLRKKGENPREIAADAYVGCPEEELEL